MTARARDRADHAEVAHTEAREQWEAIVLSGCAAVRRTGGDDGDTPGVHRDDPRNIWYSDEGAHYNGQHWVLPETVARRAHLIAAAPDLLEALEMVRDADDDCERDGLPRIPAAARARIDHAIATATGANHD